MSKESKNLPIELQMAKRVESAYRREILSQILAILYFASLLFLPIFSSANVSDFTIFPNKELVIEKYSIAGVIFSKEISGYDLVGIICLLLSGQVFGKIWTIPLLALAILLLVIILSGLFNARSIVGLATIRSFKLNFNLGLYKSCSTDVIQATLLKDHDDIPWVESDSSAIRASTIGTAFLVVFFATILPFTQDGAQAIVNSINSVNAYALIPALLILSVFILSLIPLNLVKNLDMTVTTAMTQDENIQPTDTSLGQTTSAIQGQDRGGSATPKAEASVSVSKKNPTDKWIVKRTDTPPTDNKKGKV